MVRQPDGTLACLPEWMTSPHAASFEVRDVPVLPTRALSALRAVVDAFFLSETEPTRERCDDETTKDDGAGRPVRARRPGDCDVHEAEGEPDRSDRRADIGGDDEPGPGGGGACTAGYVLLGAPTIPSCFRVAPSLAAPESELWPLALVSTRYRVGALRHASNGCGPRSRPLSWPVLQPH